ncbi:MAG: hypothetical protein KDJ39_08705 [Gammaproteobacteria bacterium]|nr:hypothetical protein [Gammaproteobacteria bacterium]MCP5298925.1 hypothetical protein [Chromatiaceae bacterium]
MKITPALLLPQRMPAPQDLTAIAAAQAVDQATDPTGREAPPRVPVQTDPVQRAQRVQAVGVDRARPAASLRAGRALAAYADVAAADDRCSLRRVLGFDAYA